MRRPTPTGSIRIRGHHMRVSIAALTLSLSSAPVAAQCPLNILQFPTLGPLTTSDPTFDVTSPDGSSIRGDHRVGEFSLHHSGSLSPTDIIASDRFDVIGVPPGTKVSVTVRFLIEGWAYTPGCGGSGCCGTLMATVRAAGEDSRSVSLSGHTFGGRADFAGVVEVPVTLVAGTPRDVVVEMDARRCPGGSHTVDAMGRMVFDGTNGQAIVVSCKGFGPISVPVLPRSWGRLKTLYR